MNVAAIFFSQMASGGMDMIMIALSTKRAGRHSGYTRMTFGTIDDVTDARANSART